MKKPTGYVIYKGASLIDGKPIVVIANISSVNSKTGNAIQTTILRDDIDPLLANKTGEDYSICGTCPHRGTPSDDPNRKTATNRTCYVNLGQGVLQVYKSYKKGNYPMLTGHKALQELGKDRVVRLGTYGDPSIVPSYIWDSLISQCKKWLGYSHQSGMKGVDYRPDIFMHSADSLEDAQKAWSKGERTFRIINHTREIVKDKEILCPSPRVHCIDCGLCGGSKIKAKSITIVVHGNGKNNFNKREVA